MSIPLRVLLVEDSPDDAELILRALRKGGYQPEHRRVDTPEELAQALDDYDWDIVLADYAMPRFSAFDALAMVQERGLDLPFIVISGTIGEEIAVEAMKAGAHDYLMKDNLARLVPAVERELREADERRARRVAEETVWHQAYHDSLTGLPNRWLLTDRLGQALAYARRDGTSVAVLFMDLDRFKLINETLGHAAGDELLRLVADRLSEDLHEGDTLARPGGDEFALVLAGLRDTGRAVETARRLVERFEAPFVVNGHELHVAATVGVAFYPEHGRDPETLVKNAETAMYAAKRAGGQGWLVYEANMESAVLDRLTLENELRRALRQGDLVVHYQPQVSLRDGRLVGVEALVRWRHPERGLIPPLRFIGLAEETGLIRQLGEQVLEQVALDYAAWRSAGVAPPRVAVNVSPVQLRDLELPRRVRDVLRRAEVEPARLEAEITESALLQAADTAGEVLRGLKALGLRVAIDDFGTGYSSLTYLKRFPVDALKIDQAFTRHVTTDSDDAAIVEAILAMARSLGLDTVAEGVETEAQRDWLANRGCDAMQGFLLSEPVPAAELPAVIERLMGTGGERQRSGSA